jgi:tetratricopeptide (TPR) repeat protein
MFDELFHSIMEQWSNISVSFFNGLEGPKILGILIPLLPACYGLYIKWRSSGYRLLDRLDEYLDQQEKRLVISRKAVSALFQCPSPARTLEQPAFNPGALSKSLRKMNWGYGTAAVNDLNGAVSISANQALRAKKQLDEFQNRQAIARLLLGAKEASRNLHDPVERTKSREAALEHFDRAIEINSGDADAIEYAGMMLLELANPAGALQRFNDLLALRQGGRDGTGLARAYRLQATAYENLPAPLNNNANAALANALAALPAAEAFERALTHEHRGNVRIKLGFYAAANSSFQSALTIYQSFRTTRDGHAGLQRVNAAIAKLNRFRIRPSKPGFDFRYSTYGGPVSSLAV